MRIFNLVWLVVVLGVLPWVASRPFGGWQIASRSAWQTLALWAVGLGILVNFLIWQFARRSVLRKSGLRWSLAFVIVGLLEALFFAGVFHFRWLQ